MSERLLGRALRRERRAVRVATWSGLAVTFSTVALAATSAWLIVRAAQRPTVLSLTVPMGLVQLFALAKAASRYLERTQTHRAALRVMGHVRAEVARDLEPLLPAGLGPHSAEVVDRAIGDVERVQDLLTAVAGPLVTSVVAGLATIVVCGLLAPTTGLVVAAAMVLDAVVVPAALWRSGSRNATEVDVTHEGLTVLFDEVAQSGDEFVMAGAGRVLESRLADLEARWDENQRRRRRVTGLAAAATVLVNGLSAALLVMVSAQALRSGHLAPALIAVPVLAALAALELVSAIAPTVATAARDRAAPRGAMLAQRERTHAPEQPEPRPSRHQRGSRPGGRPAPPNPFAARWAALSCGGGAARSAPHACGQPHELRRPSAALPLLRAAARGTARGSSC